MSVDPVKSNPASQTDSTRLGASHQARRAEPQGGTSVPTEQPDAVTGDSVQLSSASRSLVKRADDAERVPQGTVTPERMREVLQRIEGGHYNSAEVRNTVAQRAQQDLDLSATE